MSSIDFFNKQCSESPRKDREFGLVDLDNQERAFSTLDTSIPWHAKVLNKSKKDLIFHSLDRCIKIYKSNGKDMESLCDGMILFENAIYLVELKNRRGSFTSEGKLQLINTIRLLSSHHDLSSYKKKKAFISNRRRPNFHIVESGERMRFFRGTNGFRLDVSFSISIK